MFFVFGNERKLVLPKRMEEPLKNYIGKEVILGIRPENIGNKITNPEGKTGNFVNGNVSIVEYMGNEEYVYFKIDGQGFVSRIEARKSENLTHGSEGIFYFNMKKAHIFSKETEENLTLNIEPEN